MIYTSRYSNKELRSGKYTAVRISLGTPKWELGYRLNGEIKELMPAGIFGIGDKEVFKRKYFERLDKIGVSRIKSQLLKFEVLGKDVVLLCYEDIRKGPENWCHRNMFSEWWRSRTGEMIPELPDESAVKTTFIDAKKKVPQFEEMNLF